MNPLDRFAMSSTGNRPVVCFDDLAIGAGFVASQASSYAVTGYDWSGRALGAEVQVAAEPHGRTRTGALPLAADHDGYTIFKVETVRGSYAGTTFVHAARDPRTGTARVIGIWRR